MLLRRRRESERYWANVRGRRENLADGKTSGDKGVDRLRLGEFLFLRLGRSAALGAPGEGLDGHGKPGPDRAQRQKTHAEPEQTVVQEDATDKARRPGCQLGVLFDDCPVARHVVDQDETNRVEYSRPETLERASGEKDP
jgi:hypothetical protein